MVNLLFFCKNLKLFAAGFVIYVYMELNEFKQSILPLKDKLFRLALCIVRHREEAEDIVQEVLLKVWNNRLSLADINNPAAYCTVITKNAAFDRLRQTSYKIPHMSVEPHDAVDLQTPQANMQREERQTLIIRLIAALPDDKRMLIQLRDIEGESYQDIARILNISESKVKTDLFRARQSLKQQLDKMNAYGRI